VLLRSSVPGIEWPAMPDAPTAMLLALSWQLERSQWWSADELARAQAQQRRALLAHAAATVPQYEHLDRDDWGSVPIMTRDQIIAAGPRLLSRAYPAAHGTSSEIATSRSTGEPVRVRSTGVTMTMWHALTLREHLWHARDLSLRMALIRYTGGEAPPPDGTRVLGWGPATQALAPRAPMSILSLAATTDEQIAWLRREQPGYLLIYPSMLDAILRRLEATGERLPPTLRHVQSVGEVLASEIRARCLELLGVPVVDTYSAEEVGYIAIECPSQTGAPSPGYHVQAERHVVEILDDAGRPCEVGQTGRVVITDLHNFATPILRYEIGDYAEVGAPCACGRGLPVITRIIGRRRNMLTYPDGRTVFPVFAIACRKVARYRALQLVQPSVDSLRARVVPDGPFGDDARAALADQLRAGFDHPFAVEVEVVEELSRSPAGKLEEFVSLIR
jgi:phenylacetate-CoA ligase